MTAIVTASNNLISIDGSYGEGGGQIIRTACALAAVTGKAINIFNIRKNRKNPGLRTQHLIGIQSLNRLCNGLLEGAELGSEEILFRPQKIQPKLLKVHIDTAGSVTLVLQTLLLPSFFSPAMVNIDFVGGATDTHFSPSMDYSRYVFFKILERLGLKAKLELINRGFYPAGGARLSVKIEPGTPGSLVCRDRGLLKKTTIISGASHDLKRARVAERQADTAREILISNLDITSDVHVEYYDTVSAGSQINIIGEFENAVIGADYLGRLGRPSEQIARLAVKKFIKEFRSDACIDKYTCDQILPYIALSKAQSMFTASKITEHTKTNIWVIGHFLKRTFAIEKEQSRFVIRVE